MKAKHWFIFLVVLFPFFEVLYAQTINKAKLDSLFLVLEQKNKAMGSIVINLDGKTIYQKSFGYCVLESGKKQEANSGTIYRVGSISKMFTAVMIFQLVEEGKLTLATTLDNYYPQIPNAKQITIGQLLNHRSGIHSFTSDPDYKAYMTQTKSRDEMIAIIAKSQADFKPNEKAQYSNSNFVLLGYILEKIESKPYSKLLEERIASTIGLKSTYLGGKTNLEKGESYSYRFEDKWVKEPETDMSIPGGAGAVVSTPLDLARFIESLFAGKLISAGSLDQMKTITDGYGMGMFQMPFDNKKAYGHGGSIDGFVANLGYFPDEKLTVAYCSNGHVYNFNQIMIGVLSIYFGKDYQIPSFVTINIDPKELDKYTGEYISDQIPLKITVSKHNNTLRGQATGQPFFPLEAFAENKFRFEPAGIEIDFEPSKGEMILKQGGKSYLYRKVN